MTIQELRQLDSLKNISLEEWDEIAQNHDSNYNGFFNTSMSIGYSNNNSRIRNYPFDGIRIPVLEAEFKSVNNVDVDNLPFPASEPIGQAFIASLGIQGTWLQTSFNGNFRSCFCGPTYIYDATLGEYGEYVNPKPNPVNPLKRIAYLSVSIFFVNIIFISFIFCYLKIPEFLEDTSILVFFLHQIS